MKTVMIVNGAYRPAGHTDQVVSVLSAQLRNHGLAVDTLVLRDVPIAFCHNCRECLRIEGPTPPPCVIDDAMNPVVERLEAADAYVFAAPVNVGSVTALFKRFMERLTVYGIWPPGQAAPRMRKAAVTPKPALLVSSCAAPGWLGRLWFSIFRPLRMTARMVGARPVGTLLTGQVVAPAGTALDGATRHRTVRLGQRLIRCLR